MLYPVYEFLVENTPDHRSCGNSTPLPCLYSCMYAYLLLILVSLVESATRKKSNDNATVFYNSVNSMYLRTDLFDLKCQSDLFVIFLFSIRLVELVELDEFN